MTAQLKNDLKTILEVSVYLIVNALAYYIYSAINWLGIVLVAFSLGYYLYKGYFKKNNANTISFPTENDESGKMAIVASGILLLFFSSVGSFVFNIQIYYAIIGFAVGAVLFIKGSSKQPEGWLAVENNFLNLSGIAEKIDTQQLKEIILKNDQIVLLNIDGKNRKSNRLKLSRPDSANITKFLSEKLPKSEIQITDQVTDPAY